MEEDSAEGAPGRSVGTEIVIGLSALIVLLLGILPSLLTGFASASFLK